MYNKKNGLESKTLNIMSYINLWIYYEFYSFIWRAICSTTTVLVNELCDRCMSAVVNFLRNKQILLTFDRCVYKIWLFKYSVTSLVYKKKIDEYILTQLN